MERKRENRAGTLGGLTGFERQAEQLYREAFPIYEQRRTADRRRAEGNGQFRPCAVLDGADFAGLLYVWETPEFLYVEHFAILPELRGRNYGTMALEALREKGKTVILEIDPPVDRVSRNRLRFYQRLGFQANPWPHVHPPYRAGYEGHPLTVLSYPDVLTENDYNVFSLYLHETVMQYADGT